jgi:hypothetical protein
VESTLSLKKRDFEVGVARFIGFSADPDDWTDAEQDVVEDCTRSGISQFYYPALPDGRVYEWSFLKPVRSLTLASGATGLDLPDDFGSVSGSILVSESGQTGGWELPVEGIGVVLKMRAEDSDSTGSPVHVAISPQRGTGVAEGQRYRLEVWPTADAAYTLQMEMVLLQSALTGARPYAYGGAAHSETILESCLSIAEQRVNNEFGVHTQKYQERLAASIAFDQKLKPAHLGYNGDGPGRPWTRDERRSGITVTFDGVQYD